MFGSLKKKLQEAVEKVSKSIKDEPKEELRQLADMKKPEEEIPEPEPVADKMREQQKMESANEAVVAIEPPVKHAAKAEPEAKIEPEEKRRTKENAAGQSLEKIIEETKPDFDAQIQKKIDELEDLREKVAEEKLPAEIAER